MKAFSLSIPEPCHENWNNMTPQDRGRFCGSCQKTVVDFTAMSDRQMADFFKTPPASVCGHFNTDQLNRIVEPPRKRLPWIKHFFTIALPALLVTAKATAQGQPRLGMVAMNKELLRDDTILTPAATPVYTSIHGSVKDEKGNPMIGATVQLMGSQQATAVREDGSFELKFKGTDSIVQLQISSVGYLSKQVKAITTEAIEVVLSPQDMIVSGELVIAYVKKRPKKVKAEPKKEVAAPLFSLYPNPVASATNITLNTEKLTAGSYQLSIINNAGIAVQADDVIIAKGMKTFNLQLKQLPTGIYFVSLANKTTGKVLTQQLSVQ